MWWLEIPFRLKLVLVFVISILLGVPVWWRTTSLYRAPLPYSEITALTSRLIVQTQQWPMNIKLLYVAKNSVSKDLMSDAVYARFLTLLTSYNQDFVFDVKIEFVALAQDLLKDSTKSLSDDELDDFLYRTVTSSFNESCYAAFIIYDPKTTETTLTVGKYRHLWVKTNNSNNEYIVNTLLPPIAEVTATVLIDTPKLSEMYHVTTEHQMAVKPSHHYHLSFSLVNADPESRVVTWNFTEIQQTYLASLLTTFSTLANFTVDSQILHYAPLLKQPKFDSKTSTWYFTPEYLPYFLNLNEWKLDFTPDLTPTLNFILYVPSPAQSPLRIRNTDGTYSSEDTDAFLIPQWGGVVFFNPKNTSPSQDKVLDLTESILPAVQVFVSQIRELLGMHDAELRVKSIKTNINRQILRHPFNGANLWEIDALMRKQLWINYNGTQYTLKSYMAMVQELDGIPVPDSISELVWNTIAQLKFCEEFIFRGHYLDALKASQRAYKAAEEAFFEPGMLALLYFPGEHKYAIYLPLFLPLTVPVVSALWSEIKRFRQKRNEKKNK